ncbi:UDP-glucuronosyltransferase 2B7-like [Trichoplusia ni]|uniref:UDP-glucuronosyltransferase n=1 Tax=Trichoplusia ni TaxID=7111 RepID=A0A7E5W5C1_TRINI|nr:UDP-glucuronosyltransferase 2B7-like [Trichoplusia ni]
MGILFYSVTLYVLFVSTNEAARILVVVPTPAISHQSVFRPLTQELAKRGHDVTVITTHPAFPKGKAPANLTEIDVYDISYENWLKPFQEKQSTDLIKQMKLLPDLILKTIEAQLKDENIASLLRDKERKFDLLILEAYVRSLLVYAHIYKVPVIQMSTAGAFIDSLIQFGLPMHPFLYPMVPSMRTNNLTMWEKVKELSIIYFMNSFMEGMMVEEEKLLKRVLGENSPSMKELSDNVDMLFLNVNPIFYGIRPVTPNVVFVGGLHQNPEKELPEDLKSYLDSSKNGVVYLSFGSSVDPTLLPAERIQVLVKATSKLPYDVLWKWNGDELPGRTENIRISKWLPQSDLLRHPKIKLFITQGGLQSTDEAITAGVPMIGVPLLGDQWFNVERYEYLKIGVRLDLDIITEENFIATVHKVIGDDSYKKNIIKLRGLLRDEVQTSLERAVWWTEYVLRHGGAKHLRSPAANISWWEYLELELVLTLLGVLLAILSAVILIVVKSYKYFFSRKETAVKIKRN